MRSPKQLLLCMLLCTFIFFVHTHENDDEVTITSEKIENEGESFDEGDSDFDYQSPTPSGKVFFAEHFDDPSVIGSKWVKSQAKKDDADESIAKYDGVWSVEPQQLGGLKGDLGLVLKSKAKHAAISANLERPFRFDGKPLVIQYEVALQNGQECGGAYIKLLSADGKVNLKQFTDKTPYTIMFGPDKCGNDHKLHFIFRHKNPVNGTLSEKHCKRPKDRLEEPFKDKKPHLYTLIIQPDNSFEVKLDQSVVNSGSLLEDFTPPVNPPAEIDDPKDKKPSDWDEREKIPDPSASKPEDWDEDAPPKIKDQSAVKAEGWLDDEPEMIPDPNAVKPGDWDNDMDGEWEPPMISNPACEGAPGCGDWNAPLIDNPAFKGKWRAPLIDNPNYKGKWKPRKIPNPDYFEDKDPYKMTPIGAIGIELWSMSDNILFDNIIITDDLQVAEQWAADTFQLKKRKYDKDAESVVSRLLKYTNDRPWLWAVYIVVVGLPIVMILSFCFSSSSKEREEQRQSAYAKKTDVASVDDAAEDEGASGERQEGEEDEAEEGEQSQGDEEGAAGDRSEEEQEEDLEEEEEDEDKADSSEETADANAGEPATRSSPRRRRVQKE